MPVTPAIAAMVGRINKRMNVQGPGQLGHKYENLSQK
jgi:hypothetical protein